MCVDVVTHTLGGLSDESPIEYDWIPVVCGFSLQKLINLFADDNIMNIFRNHLDISYQVPLHTTLSLSSNNFLFTFSAKWFVHLLANASGFFSCSISFLLLLFQATQPALTFLFIMSWRIQRLMCLVAILRTTTLSVIRTVSSTMSSTFSVLFVFFYSLFRNTLSHLFVDFLTFFCVSFNHQSLRTTAMPVEPCWIWFAPNCPVFGGPVLGF